MQLYAIRRRNGWTSPDALQTTAGISSTEGDKPGSGVRWIRSYVLGEDAGARAACASPRRRAPRSDTDVRNLLGTLGLPLTGRRRPAGGGAWLAG